MSQTPDLVVGIDLGTTNSAIAAVLDEEVQVLPVADQLTMPSAVGLDPSGQLIVGQAARNQAISTPEATILSIKRLMGTDATVSLGDRSYRPEEISALILAELKRAAERHLGRPVTHAVITVPAFFNERQRQATQDAGRLAGLEVMRIINEPTAAALAYGADRAAAGENELLLVYDLGGGTFDVSLVSVENGIVEVRASHGDTHLGGDDFDEELVKMAAGAVTDDADGRDLPEALHRRLKVVMERAKMELSDAPFAQVREEFITEARHLQLELDRNEYERAISPLLEKTLHALQRALTDAGSHANRIEKVLLVGGATRTPAVQSLLRDYLQVEPRHEINPDLIVAMGAAIQGAALAGRPAPAILVDITAHTYSTGAMDPTLMRPICVPIIRRGTALPAKRSEVFMTMYDGQQEVDVRVFQGESLEPEENLPIGEFRVEGLADVPAGNPVLSTFQIDLNGLLTVTATEKSSGLAKSITIQTGNENRLDLDAARRKLAGWLESESFETDELEDGPLPLPAPGESGQGELLASAKSLRKRASTLLEGELSEADTKALEELLERMSETIRQSDWEALESVSDQLSDLLFYLED